MGWEVFTAEGAKKTSEVGVTYSATIPSNPLNGDIWIYTPNTGIRWAFSYNSLSASSYKWEFIGGAALVDRVNASESTSSNAFVDLTTNGPEVTLPFSGDYEFAHGATAQRNGASASAAIVQLYDGTSQLGVLANDTAADNTHTANPSQLQVVTGLTASTTVRLRYRNGSAVSVSYSDRYLSVTPVRVG